MVFVWAAVDVEGGGLVVGFAVLAVVGGGGFGVVGFGGAEVGDDAEWAVFA